MTMIFREVERLLTSQATTLEDLAAIVGLTVEELFEGERFAGVDLCDEPVAVLLRLDADFSGAILSREQQRALRDGRGARAERDRSRKVDAVWASRRERMGRYIATYFAEDRRVAARAALLDPLLADAGEPLKWQRAHFRLAGDAVGFVLEDGDGLRRDVREAVLALLIQFKAIRLPLDVGVIDALSGGIVTLDPSTVHEVIDLDHCTERFVLSWLDQLGPGASRRAFSLRNDRVDVPPANPHGSTSDAYADGLKLAIEAPSRPAASYLANILDRARSIGELRDLVSRVPPQRIDQTIAGLLARVLARAATSAATIKAAALDEGIDRRVRRAFRSHIVAAGTLEGREALLSIIASAGEQASGLEVILPWMGGGDWAAMRSMSAGDLYLSAEWRRWAS